MKWLCGSIAVGVIGSVLVACPSAVAGPRHPPSDSTKAQSMTAVLRVMTEVAKIAAANHRVRPDRDITRHMRSQIYHLIGRLKQAQELYYAAAMCRAILSYGPPEDRGYNHAIEAAYQQSMDLLSRKTTPSAVDWLHMLDTPDLDGAEKMFVRDCIDEQARRVEAKRRQGSP